MKSIRLLGLLELLLAALLAAAGVWTLRHPLETLLSLSVLYGVLALISGILDIVFYARLECRTGFGPVTALVGGILSALMGLLLLFWPGTGAAAMTVLLPVWLLAHSISQLARLPLLRWTAGSGAYTLDLLLGILELVAGVVLLFAPMLSMRLLPWLLGLCLLLAGVAGAVLGLQKLLGRR